MKRTFPLTVLTLFCVGFYLTFIKLPRVAATGTVVRWVGDVSGGQMGVSGGPPNTTVQYNFTETNPGLIIYSTSQFGTYTNSLTLNINLNGAGNGSAPYYSKAVQPGLTTETICSPQLNSCASNSPTDYLVNTPASGVATIQYLKNGAYVDVPDPLTVLKGDTVTFNAIPSPAGSVFFFTSLGQVDPSWSGLSGATGVGYSTTVTFNTASSNNHDYKTVIASVQNGTNNTANVLVVNGVQSVTIDKIDQATLFDDNPNTGLGKRVFPDKNGPSDTVDRKRVRVNALTSLGSKKTIYFKSFDLDDPSTDAGPVDTNGPTGNDNRGGQGSAAQFGILSAVGGTGTTNSASAKTDNNGTASVDLTVTMQAGDNFMVAASDDSAYLNGLTVNQILLQDSGGNIVGSGTPKAKASPMLTVWRRVHLEVDSMEAVPTTGSQKNSITGNITSINGTSTIATIAFVDQNLDDGSPKLDNAPPNNGNGRFENGTIRIGTAGNVTATADLQGNGALYVQKNTGSGIVIPCTVSKSGETDVTGNVISLLTNVFKISITGGTLTSNFVGGAINVGGVSMNITAVNTTDSSVTVDALGNIPIELVDDDVAGLPQVPDTSLVEEKYQPAYIMPVVDGGGDPNNNNNKTTVPFKLYIQSDSNSALDTELNATNALESDGNRADSFWVAYLLSAYQGNPSVTVNLARGDNDADSESGLGGVNSGVNGRGAFIFVEDIRDEEHELGITIGPSVPPHEIAHQFGLLDCGSPSHSCDSTIHDLMGSNYYLSDSKFSDADLNTLRNRIKSPGRQ
jgi:hypothetical protein